MGAQFRPLGGGVVSVIHKDESWGDDKAPESQGLGGRGVAASLAHLSDTVPFLELLGRKSWSWKTPERE